MPTYWDMRCCESLDAAVAGAVRAAMAHIAPGAGAVRLRRGSSTAAANRVALVFGPRITVSATNLKASPIDRVPADPIYPFNLAQAVMVCCYELPGGAPRAGNARPPPTRSGGAGRLHVSPPAGSVPVDRLPARRPRP
jgi:tRNA C32,U32 (ribose-2'-O)-methylase TrmJ